MSSTKLPYIFRKEQKEVPGDWTIKKYSEVLNLEYGNNLPEKDREAGSYPVYGSNGITGWHNEYHVESPGIVVGRKGSLEAKLSQEPFNVIDTAYYVNDECIESSRLNLKYLYYNLKSFDFEILESGSAVPSLSRDDFYNETVALPPYIEQQKITAVLESIDYKVKLNNQITSTLEEVTKTLFKSWFVDFEPYEKFKDSELGEIPAEFEVKNLVDIADVTYGYSFSSSKFNENKEGIPVIRIRNIPDDEVGKYTSEGFDNKYLVNAGDVLAGMDGEFRPHIWKGPEAALNQRVCRFEGKRSIYSKIYLWNAVRRPLYKLEQSKTGTTVIHLGKRDIEDIELPVPDDQSLTEFNNGLKPLYKEMINRQKENKKLEAMRNTLLPKLMSGEIRVNDISLEDLEVDNEV